MAKHSTMIGGSSAKRVMNCPGSWSLGQTMPKKPSSGFADEGTLLHNAMAMILTGDVDTRKDVIGLVYGEHVLDADMFDEMIIPALGVLDEIRMIGYVVEQRVEFPNMPGEFGTADLIGYNDDFTVVLDWKFGRGVYVSPIANAQAMYYGAAATYNDWAKNKFKLDKPVRLYVVQPAFPSNQPYDVVSVEDLLAFETQLKQTTRMMKKDNAPFKLGDWCKWCPAEDACPLKTKLAMDALKDDGPLEPAELGRWLRDDAPHLDALIKSRRTLARDQIEAGHDVPGMKLVAGRRGARAWDDKEEAETWLRSFGRRIKVGEMFNSVLKSPTQVEKLLKTKNNIDLNKALVVQPAGKAVLVGEDAEGEALPKGASAFEAFGNS